MGFCSALGWLCAPLAAMNNDATTRKATFS
jgi:hypothetical protein